MKKLPFLIFLFFHFTGYHAANGQSKNHVHNTLWTRLTLSSKVSKKTDFDLEFQHRRQNLTQKDRNLLNYNLLHSARVWLHYKPAEQIRFSFSPFAYFYGFPLLTTTNDLQRKPGTEIRLAAHAEISGKLNNLTINSRYGFESRWFKNNTTGEFIPEGRFRTRLLGEWKFKSGKSTIYLYDDLFLKTGKNVRTEEIYNQNRTGFGYTRRLGKNLKADIGYMFIHSKKSGGPDNDLHNNLVMNLTWLLHKGK